ncbi:E3 ubiquitin-protein ligase MARCH6 [Collichthys lucidus]|uniref:E3 ubiquitin-protein ligase MARCHF6 n=1 Tax=Collichthys lucidus TaxID=240159 RepID=A0A4U5UZD5_COLLU|nr:E3 ubiquitin-protein ligase MARCH6 [Collichthys lucidus]
MDTAEEDICRVCRSEGTQDKPLYHPCVCTGSIKFIHQECLLQWLKHSRKEYCELCKHRFAFTPIYSPDMPSRLPVQDIFAGLVTSIGTAIRYWFHYTLVAFAWLGVVPLTACRIYKCLFTGSVSSLLTLPLDMLSTQNLLADCLQGCFVVTCTLCAFISLVWLREQIVHGGAPQWLERNQPPLVPNQPNGPAPANEVPGGNNGQAAGDGAEAQHPADPAPEGLEPANPHEAGNHGDEAELDDEEEDDNGEEDEEEDDDEEGREEDAAEANNGGQEDLNWNALEWDRAAEELTWEREHVFWVVSLNTLFILVFAFCPYHIGHFSVVGLGFEDYGLASLVKFQRSRRLLGVCYIVVKEMFDATLKDREQSFDSAPGTTMFLHWLVGMVYVFYFASFILLLREVVFGSIVLLMLWLPIRIIKLLFPTFLPYNVMLYSDAPVSELSLELLLLQVVLPALLEQGHTRQWLKRLVHAWTFTAGYMFDLHSYLLGDHEDDDNQPNNNPPGRHNNNRIPGLGEGLHAAHQAILQQGGPMGFQSYHRPINFPLKIILLVIFMCGTLLTASLICLTLPVCAGRWLMSFWMGSAMVHELYTAASGLYVCWLSIRAATVLLSWMPQGRSVIMLKVQEWTLTDWALGVLHAKIIAAITLMGPQWWLKTVIEQVYANGIRNIDLHFIVQGLAAPVICILLLSLCVPYTISKGITPLLGVQPEMQSLVERRIYPFLLMVVMLLAILSFQIRQFKRLYEHIKNDKYLVGQRLVNYEPKNNSLNTLPFIEDCADYTEYQYSCGKLELTHLS